MGKGCAGNRRRLWSATAAWKEPKVRSAATRGATRVGLCPVKPWSPPRIAPSKPPVMNPPMMGFKNFLCRNKTI